MTTKVIEIQWSGTDFFRVWMMYRCLTADCQSLWLQIRLKVGLRISLYNYKVSGKAWDAESNVNHWEKQGCCFSSSMLMTVRNILQMVFSCISGWHQYRWEMRRSQDLGQPFFQCPINNCMVCVTKRKFGKQNPAFVRWKKKNNNYMILTWASGN